MLRFYNPSYSIYIYKFLIQLIRTRIIRVPISVKSALLPPLFIHLNFKAHELADKSEHTVSEVYILFRSGDAIAITEKNPVVIKSPIKDAILIDYSNRKYTDRDFSTSNSILGRHTKKST